MKHKPLVFIAATVVTASLLASRFHVTARQMEAQIKTDLPIGSSRGKVNDFIDSHGMGLNTFAFDYPSGHSLQGKITLTKIRPFLSLHDIYLAFYFDKQQNLSSYEVSERPLSPKDWPQQQH